MPTRNSHSCNSSVEIDQRTQVGIIRRQVAKRQRSQKDTKLRELKEHEHFELNIKQEGGELVTSIQCKVCSRSYSLGVKEGRPMISNWTKHVSKCVLKPKPISRKVEQYFKPKSPPPSINALTSESLEQHLSSEESNHHFLLSPPA